MSRIKTRAKSAPSDPRRYPGAKKSRLAICRIWCNVSMCPPAQFIALFYSIFDKKSKIAKEYPGK
jgi:hypothetical protein